MAVERRSRTEYVFPSNTEFQDPLLLHNGLFPPTETETEMDPCTESFPDRYIVLCTTFSTGRQMETFLDGYCTHFRDASPSQGQNSIPILLYFNKGIGIHLRTSGKTCLVQ